MEERKDNQQDVGNVPDNQKKPAQGENKGGENKDQMEDRNRSQNQGQQDKDKDKKSA